MTKVMTREAIRAARERAAHGMTEESWLTVEQRDVLLTIGTMLPNKVATALGEVVASIRDQLIASRTDVLQLCDTAEAYHDLVERVLREAEACEAAARLAGGSMTPSGRQLFARAQAFRDILTPGEPS